MGCSPVLASAGRKVPMIRSRVVPGALGEIEEEIGGGVVAPVEILEEQNDGGLAGRRLQEGPDFPQHALGRRRHHGGLEALRLAFREEPGDLDVPAGSDALEQSNERLALWRTEETLECFQHRHVGLALSVLLDALSLQDVDVGARPRERAEEFFAECGLADARLTGDEGKLPFAPLGLPETLMELMELGRAAHETMDGSAVCRPRCRCRRDRAKRRLGSDLTHLCHEAKAAAVDRLDEARHAPRVSERSPELGDRLRQGVVGHRRLGPDVAVKSFLRDEEPGAFDEVAQDVPGLRPEGDLSLSASEAVAGHIHVELAEHELTTGDH